MVRLKDKPYPVLDYNDFYFNSNMVRLKEAGIYDQIQFTLFQFQYGAIKSDDAFSVCRVVSEISIPIWCD